MKAAFYSPYLDTLGGGEKYLLDIAKVLYQQGYAITFFWPDSKIKDSIKRRFGKDFNFLSVDQNWNQSSWLSRIIKSSNFDLFFFHSDGSYFLSMAKKSYVILQAPTTKLLPKNSLFARLKFGRFVPVYYNNFVKRFFTQHGVKGQQYVLSPMIGEEFNSLATTPKKKIILSVGRFFSQLHSKKQEILIKAFNYAQQHFKEFRDFTLILAGSYKEEDKKYLQLIELSRAHNPSIVIKTNVTHHELLSLYSEAMFYWHATGYGENEKKHPERMEHFGISIVESMASGCVPIAFDGGGPKETILHGKNGYLFDKRIELIELTAKLIQNTAKRLIFAQKSQERAREKYGYRLFTNNVLRMIE